MPLIDDLESRRVEAERHKDNSARPAASYARFTTTGQGTIEHPDRIKFDLTFIEEPVMAYGNFVDIDKMHELQVTRNPILPVCTGYVTEWDVNDRGFYTGCWIAVRVYFGYEDFGIPITTVDPTQADVNTALNETRKAAVEKMNQAEIQHYFTFQGVGIKDIPLDVTD